MKKALICGVSGQDGAYIARLLLEKGYEVYGGSRDSQMSTFKNLSSLGIKNDINLLSINLNDFRSTLQSIIKIKPDEIYNLSGQSSVGLSFEQPVETLESISIGTLNILESIRFSNSDIKFYNAGSSECFGDTKDNAADENTLFQPRSPYAVAKSTAFWLVSSYRESYNINASTGILFNHESPLRPDRFVTKKIISTMSYSTVKKNGFPDLGIYQKAYNIVRESDLLAAYDFDRTMIYQIRRNNNNLEQAFVNSSELFETRVLKHIDDKLITSDYGVKKAVLLQYQATKRMAAWKNLLNKKLI